MVRGTADVRAPMRHATVCKNQDVVTSPTQDELVLRPAPQARVFGWSLAVFGIVFGASGLSQSDDTGTLLTMALAGLAFTAAGLTLATARARVNAVGIRYRNGLQRKSIPARDVAGITVGPGSGTPPPRLAFVVHRPQGRDVRLIGVQRWRSDSTSQEMVAAARDAEVILGIGSR
jgi:hypothetical protein